MATKKTCSRCNGKGWGKWVVDHGRCFKCFGAGIVVVYTAAEKKQRRINEIRKHMAELEETAAGWKTAVTNAVARYPEEKQAAKIERRLERHLPPIREQWKNLAAELATLTN